MQTPPDHDSQGTPPQRPHHHGSRIAPMVLVVSSSPTRRHALARVLERDDLAFDMAGSVDDARRALADAPTLEAVVVDVPQCSAATIRFVREVGERQLAALVVCPLVSFDEAVEAMRAGAADIVPAASTDRELSRREALDSMKPLRSLLKMVRNGCETMASTANP